MKTKHYKNGTQFEETFTVTLRGEVCGRPVGCGSAEHEKHLLEDELHQVVKNAVAKFYQCQLEGTSLMVTNVDI